MEEDERKLIEKKGGKLLLVALFFISLFGLVKNYLTIQRGYSKVYDIQIFEIFFAFWAINVIAIIGYATYTLIFKKKRT